MSRDLRNLVLSPVRLIVLTILLLGTAADRLPGQVVWSLQEDLRIGAVDGERYALTRVSGLAVDPDGTIYVAHTQENRIRVFDAEGNFLRFIGGPGGGPGEFRALSRVGILGDTLWATDSSLQRLSLFSPDGRLLNTERITVPPEMQRGYGFFPIAPLSDGTVAATHGPSARAEPTQVILRISREGEVRDTLALVRPFHIFHHVTEAGWHHQGRAPVSDHTLFGFTADGAAMIVVDAPAPTTDQARVRVEIHLLDTDSTFVRTYRSTARRIPPARKRQLREPLIQQFEAILPTVPSELVETIPVPEYEPAVRRLVIGQDRTIWLQGEMIGADLTTWRVLDSEGRRKARFELPADVQLHAADRRHAWGVVHDEWDVPYVVRYRIVPAPQL